MKDMFGLMKQAQAMQQKMADLQAELDNVLVEGQAGAGMVKITMTAKGIMRGVAIDPSLMKESEKEIVEDLIVTAHEDARRKGEALVLVTDRSDAEPGHLLTEARARGVPEIMVPRTIKIAPVPLLLAVGHPVAVDPDPRLAQEAGQRGWPVLTLARDAHAP